MTVREAKEACKGGPIWTSDDGCYSDHYILLPDGKMIYYGHDMLMPTYLSSDSASRIQTDPRYEWEPIYDT